MEPTKRPLRFPCVGQRVTLIYTFRVEDDNGKRLDSFKAGVSGAILSIDSYVNKLGDALLTVRLEDGRKMQCDTLQLQKTL